MVKTYEYHAEINIINDISDIRVHLKRVQLGSVRFDLESITFLCYQL